MSDSQEKAGTFVLSAIACFVLAALLVGIGWWAMSGFLAGQEDIANFSSGSPSGRRPGPGILSFLGFVGLAAFLGTALFVGLGVAVIYKGAFAPKKKAEREDDSWRRMPAPSDSPKGRRPLPPRR